MTKKIETDYYGRVKGWHIINGVSYYINDMG